MATGSSNEKHHAHELIERLAPSQVSAVVSLLEVMLDPVSRAIANAPIDDEPETEQERHAVSDSKSWFERRNNQGFSTEDLLGDFNLSPEDLDQKA